MRSRIEILKGTHPGAIISGDLRYRKISQKTLAGTIGVPPQALNAVITGRRHLTTAMALKIEQALGYEEGFLLTLQAFYEISEYKNRMADASVKGIPAIRRILFWDTDFDRIQWGRSKEYVIERVMERGDEAEKQEIARFYGMDRAALDRYMPDQSWRIPYKYRKKS